MVEYDRWDNSLMHNTKTPVCNVCLIRGRDTRTGKEGKINENVYVKEKVVNTMPSMEDVIDKKVPPRQEKLRSKPMFWCKEHFLEMIMDSLESKISDRIFVAICDTISDSLEGKYIVGRKYTKVRR